MKQLLRKNIHALHYCLNVKMLLAFVAVHCLFFSGICMNQASAAGGDLVRPADSDTPQPGKQEAKASVVDTAGNLIVTGYQNLVGNTDDDFWTVKFMADGTIAWRKSYNRAGGSDQATAIALDSNNNVIVTGFAWNGNNYDIYTVKYRSDDGMQLWDHTYNAPALGNDIATCITVDTLNNIYVGGYVQTATANEDYVILKYSVDGPTTEGAPFWVATWNGTANGADKLASIVSGTGGIAVTGQSWGGGTNFDVMTVKYDYSGVKLWEKSYTSPGGYPDGGRKVAIDAVGNVVMTAAVTNNGNLDIYTAKYPAGGGDPLWEKTYNNPINNDEPSGLILDSSGNTYVTGYTFTLTGNEDLLAVRYSVTDGVKEWEKVFDSGSSNSDFGTDLLLDSAGNILVTGNTVTPEGNHNVITLKIRNDSSNPALYWAATYDGPAGRNEETVGIGIGLGVNGVVIVGGWTDVWTNETSDEDYLMLVYDPGLLNPPSLLTATVLTDTDITIDWTDNSTNEDGFRLERKLTEVGEWLEVGTVGADISTFTDTAANGLIARNTYYYRVRSYNAADGSSNPSEEIRVLTLFVNYQPPSWSYIYNSPDNLDDYSAAGIAAGSDNNPVVTGYSQSTANGFDYFTVKLSNSDGTLLWSDRYDDADGELDKATNIAVDSSNSAIVTGYSSLYYPPAASNINSIYTLKYPSSCSPPTPCTPTPAWNGQYNGPGAIDDRAVAVATTVDASDSVVVTGYGKNAAENEDIYLLKYAASPTVDEFGKAVPEWSAMPYNSDFNGDDFPAGVAFDKDGNVFVVGHVQSSSAPLLYKSFAAKYCGKAGAPCNGKAPGEIIWQDSFAGSGDNRARSLAVDKDGNLYVAGFDTGANGRDILLIKYDGKAVPPGSRVLWNRTVDGAAHGDDDAISVKYDLIDDTVVVGGTVLTASNDQDLTVIRFDSAGTKIEERSRTFFRPDSDEVATAMAMDVSGNVSIAGYTSTGLNSDAISVEYDYTGTLLASTVFNGTANSYDEATAVTFNPLGDTYVAGYSTNATGNADYLVYKRSGLPLQASSPFTATQYYTKADLVWADTSSGETGFYVERKTGDCASGNPWVLLYTTPANSTTYTDPGLNVGQEYCYRVRSFKSGEIEPRWIERYILLDNPVPPGNPVATPVNTTKVDVTWQDNTTGETGFKIFRCSGVGCTDSFELGAVGSNSISYSDTTVVSGLSYSYKILSYKTGDWESAYSPIATVTAPTPVAPTALSATRLSEGAINLSWSDANSDETGFRIERCEGSSCSAFSQIGTVGADVLTFNDTIALKADTTYRYQVRAYKTALNSWNGPYSDGAEATTTLSATSGLSAAPVNTTTINLSWGDNTGTETGFKIERCLGNGCSDFGEVGETPPGATTWSDGGVCSGATYTYQVRAVNAGLSMGGGGSWIRRKPLTISNFQPNFQTKVTVAYDPDMQADFDDIRFYDETTKRELPYYLENKTDGSTATVYIKTGLNNTIKIYYGNASATSGSNAAMVFELFDDFDSLAAWTVSGSSVTASGGILSVDPVTTTPAALYRNFNIAYPYIAESRYRYPTANALRNRLYMTTSSGTGSPTGFDYGLFDSGGHRVHWNGTWNTILTINNWYTLQWEVTDSNYSFKVFDTAGTLLDTRSTGTTIADLKRAYFAGSESTTSDFNLDWFRIRKYASTVPAVSFGTEEASTGYTFTNTWVGLPTDPVISAPTPIPTAVTTPTATRMSEARIDLGWTDTTADESGFRIERCKGGSCTDFAEIGTVGANVTTFSDTTPMDVDATYRYQVRAYKTATCSWNGPDPAAIVSAVTTLEAPAGLSAAASISSTCEDLRFTDSDGSTLLNYWIESGCGTPATKIWLKAPTIPVGSRQFYLYWTNTNAPAVSSATATFDFYDDFNGTIIDTGKWVKADIGNYLSQNNELIATGGNNQSGITTMYSTANFARPFILEYRYKHIGNTALWLGVKDTTTGTSYSYYPYAVNPNSTYVNVYESGTNRGSKASMTSNVWGYYKFEVLGTGAKYYFGNSASTYSLIYDSVYSTANPLKIGFDNALQSFRMDDVRIRKYAAMVPTSSLGVVESGTFILTDGTWYVRRPITLTNSGTALTDYQQELTLDTSASASNRISLQWIDTTASETGFIVERCTGAACDFSTVDTFTAPVNATSFVDKSVDFATSYCYRIKAEKSAVWITSPSNSACAVTSTIDAPVLTVTPTTSNALSWSDTTTGEDGFSIERCSGVDCDFLTLDSGFPLTVAPNVTSYTDVSVCGSIYRYRVRSFKYGSSGWSVYSNSVDATTTLPSAPGNLAATRISELQINLGWIDNTTDESGFKLERCEGAGCSSFSQIADLPPNTLTYSDTNRVPDTTYRYRIRAYKSGGCGWETANSSEAEATASVAAPSGMTATAATSTLVNLAWFDTTLTETAFKLERCEGASCSNYTPLATSGANVTSYADTSVCSGSEYTYRLTAVNEGNINGGGGAWTQRKKIGFDNFEPNFLVKADIPYDPLMKVDFADIRFVDTTAGIELPYWIESKTDSSSATVWFKTGNNSDSIYLYYGNPAATNAGSMATTFGSGLKAYYPFNEANGTVSGTTADVSGNGNNLALTNFASGYGVKTGGVYGNALSLNGSNNYAKLDAPNVPTGSVASIEAWIYPKAYADATYNGIVSWSSRNCNSGLALSIQNSGRLSMPTWCNDFVPTSGPTATLNSWNHVAAVLNGKSATLYTNGQPVGTTTLTNLPTLTSVKLAIGELDYPGRYFNGMIDEVRIYNRVLTAEEIAGRYAAALPSITLWESETISAANTYGWTYTSPAALSSVTTPVLAAPASLWLNKNSESQITVSWSNVTGETAFELERCIGDACDFSSKTTVVIPADTLSYIDMGLAPNTWYRYRIRSRADAACIAFSPYNTTPAQIQTTVTAPSSLSATALNTTQINLAWGDTTAADTGFKIERCLGASCADFSQIAVTGSSATSYADTAVCPSSSYRYRIAAVNTGLSNAGGGCWTRRKPLTISNFQADFQTKVVVAYAADMRPDFADIRFYDSATYQELPYWVETKTDSTTATFWVKTRTSSTIYLYYGNAAATSSSNGATTFDFFDDFSGTTINPAKWTTVGSYYSQNDELLSTGGSGGWDSGMYSAINFSTPFVFEIDHYRTAGGNMMIGSKNTGTGISYTDFTHAAYPVYDGNGNRLLVYEDGNWRGDNLKTISSGVWQSYRFDVLYPGAKFYHGASPATYTDYYTSTYSYATPLKIGFTNANMAFRMDNARVRKYASPEPTVTAGAEEAVGCYAFTGAYSSSYSTVVAATTPAPVPPSALTATATTDTNINLTWIDGANDETVFRIERCSGVSCSSFTELTTVSANMTAISDTVVASTDYCYRVRADKPAACGTGWPTLYTNTVCDKTFSPRTDSITATPLGSFKIRLDWHDLATDEDGYIVQVQVWNGEWIKIATLPADTTTYLDTIAIEPLKTYTYRVRPYRGSDYSPFVLSNPVTTLPFSPGAGTCP